MENNIKISVIIAVYNGVQYINQCLKNVTSQSLQEIEIICINDGSTDNSEELLLAWSKKDERIKVITQENQGAGIARNNGLAHASGEFIAFMDIDDLYPDNYALERLYNLTQKYQTNAAGGSLQVLNGNTKRIGQFNGIKYFFDEEKVITFKELQQAFYYQRFIYSRKVLQENAIKFPYYKRSQDPPFLIRALLACNNIAIMKEYSYLYRQSDKEFNFSEEQVNHFLEGHIEVLKLCVENDLEELFNWCVLRIEKNKVVHKLVESSFLNGNKEIISLFGKFNDIVQENKHLLKEDVRLEYVDIFLTSCLADTDEEIQNAINEVEKPELTYQLKEKPLVSIIFPIYNVEKYVNIAISSILNQSYENIELICINDGTKDNSMEIVNKWAEKDSRIIVLEQENQGLSAARNTGMKHAKGKYMQFVDSDDIIPQYGLEYFVSVAEKGNLDFLTFNASTVFDDYQTAFNNQFYLHYYNHRNGSKDVLNGRQLCRSLLDNDSYRTNVVLFLFNTEFLKTNNLMFEKGIVHEDNLFSFQCFLVANRVQFVPVTGYIRRIRDDSIMTKKTSFKNVYGYFISYLKGTETLHKSQLSEDVDSLNEVLHTMIKNARYKYKELDDEERLKEKQIPDYLKADFQATVLDYADFLNSTSEYKSRLQQAFARNSEMKEKLQETYKEKLEINEKLQQTYKEKSEINATLQKTYKEKADLNKKLQQTYKEKSEINAKLKQTYKEKSERGVAIKKLKEEVETIKQSKSYKLARMLAKLKKPFG